jgi:site-specific recombinase XerD
MGNDIITRSSPGLVLQEAPPPEINPAILYLAGLGGRAANPERSRRTMEQALETIAGLLARTWKEYPPHSGQYIPCGDPYTIAWGKLRYQHTWAIRAMLVETESASSAKRKLTALRGVLKQARRLGQMSADDYLNAAELELNKISETKLPAGRDLGPGELRALLDTCTRDQTPAGVRDAAIIALLYGCGLRRAEVVALNVEDYDREGGKLQVRGKGKKERYAFPANGAAAALADWLTIRGDEPGPLFYPIRKGGHVRRGRLTTQAIYHVLQERAEQAGVRNVRPHDLRRSFVGDMLDAGADLSTVQKMVGHADSNTTARYDRRGDKKKREAARLLHVPYRRQLPDL